MRALPWSASPPGAKPSSSPRPSSTDALIGDRHVDGVTEGARRGGLRGGNAAIDCHERAEHVLVHRIALRLGAAAAVAPDGGEGRIAVEIIVEAIRAIAQAARI